MEVVKINHLEKTFGKFRALNDVSFTVNSGEILGFIGPNGSGKSTTIRILLGLLRPSGGSATIFGKDVFTQSDSIHENIAYVPGETNVWKNMKGGDILLLFSKLRKNVDLSKQKELIERFDFDVNKTSGSYSKGNRQKIALISALSTDADLYIFDEPTSGLDPLMESVFQTEVRRLKKEGKAVLLSSHILSEVENLADRVAIIKEGNVIDIGSIADMRHLSQSKVTVSVSGDLANLNQLKGIHDLVITGQTARFRLEDDATAAVMKFLSDQGIRSISNVPPTLEELFVGKYEKGD